MSSQDIWPRNPLQKSAENRWRWPSSPNSWSSSRKPRPKAWTWTPFGCASRMWVASWTVGPSPRGNVPCVDENGAKNGGILGDFSVKLQGKTLEKCGLFEWWKLLDVGKSNGKWWNVNGISIGMWWNNIMVLVCFDVILMGIQWEFIFNNIGWIYQQHCGIPWEHLLDI